MNRTLLTLLAPLAVAATAATGRAAEDILIADFEGADYGAWKTTGTAFGSGPALGALPGQMAVDGFRGKGLVNSFHGGDAATGTLTSPEFRIERRFIAFLIGGGKDPERLAVQLLVEGKVVRSETGPNDRPGGAETLSPASWEVAEFAGKAAVLRIVDEATGGWGHINVDHIVQTDRKPAGTRTDATREFTVSARFLHLPIKNGAKRRVVTLLVDGKPVVRNDVELADAKPDWWAPMDVSAWKGRTVAVRVDRLPDDSAALELIEPGDDLKDVADLYREPLRGRFHFSPRRGWNNDPNGMAFFNGEYHLFFQHNPYGRDWGNMHWGHAVSKDLIHWEELGDKLLPDAMGPMFSGSAVVDRDNTSGFGRDGKAPLVLIYTAAGNPATQCLAYSLDGRTFTKYEGNPVVKQIAGGNRDPKVFWHAPTKRWVMVLYVGTPNGHAVHFLTSPNLRDWTPVSVTESGGKGGFLYECPDFFELPVDGDAKNSKWVLMGANTEYAVGTFDGTKFTPEAARLPGHRGKGLYAPQTFSDIPAADGRRIQIGWFQTPTPGMPFSQSMSLPLELRLTATPDGPRLTWTPVKELETLRTKTHQVPAATLEPGGANPLADVRAELVELRAEFEPPAEGEVVFTVRGAIIAYDAKKRELSVNGHRAPAPLREGRQTLTVFCDRTGLEVFAAGGLTFVPMPFTPKADDLSLGVSAKGGAARLASLTVHELRSAWPAK
jgi:sucrose-6-phosphate hydrolase SacC (GH32 family)